MNEEKLICIHCSGNSVGLSIGNECWLGSMWI